ncbi:hypothetical protein H7U34_01810 [Collinsella tanakaei]|nr:hypothetical protein [Collinsella tanakaei]
MATGVVDYGKSGRKDTYTFVYVNPFTLEETGELAEVEQGASKLTWNYEGENILSGSISFLSEPDATKLIRIKHTIEVDGITVTETLGTLFLDWTNESAKYGMVDTGVNAYSTYWRFTQDCIVQDFARPVGYNVVQEIREIVEADGGKLKVREGVDTSRTHTIPICFEIETNRAEVINTIAGWIGCEVSVDADGYIVLQPYIEPRLKTPKYDFKDNENCTYVVGFDLEDNKEDMVNRVVAYYSTKESTDRVMVDLPDNHPFSYQSIGRRVSHFIKLQDAVPHDELNNQAVGYLNQHSTASTKYIEIEHAFIPGITVGDVVTYTNSTDYREPISYTCQVLQMDMALGNGGMCDTKLKVVS